MKRLILVDSREKKKLSFPTLPTRRATLQTGDFTLWGYRSMIAVEHKRWGDYVGCISTGSAWKKFREGQLTRLRDFEYKIILVTGHLGLQVSNYSMCSHNIIIDRTSIIIVKFGIPVVFTSNERLGARFIENYLLNSAKDIDTR